MCQRIGLLVLVGKFALKVGPKLFGIGIKALKGAKFTKIGLAAASFGLWDILLSWQFALIIMLTIGIHESGHVWAMKRVGMKTKGFYFIPLLGGAAVPEADFPSYSAEAFVAIMGPIWGGLMILPCVIAWYLTGNTVWLGVTSFVAMVNLFNLLPILPLDGGRILHAISFSISSVFGSVLAILGTTIAVVAAIKLHIGLFGFLAVVGALEITRDIWKRQKVRRLRKKLDAVAEVFPAMLELEDDGHFAFNLEATGAYKNGSREEIEHILQKLDALAGRHREGTPEYPDLKTIQETTDDVFDQCFPDWISRALENAVHQEAKCFAPKRFASRHFPGWSVGVPMRSRGIAAAAGSFVGVAALLLTTMFLVAHIPGASAALDLFR